MDIAPINQKTGYVRWMKGQGLPVHMGHGMADLRTLEVAPWERMVPEQPFIIITFNNISSRYTLPMPQSFYVTDSQVKLTFQ
jgi:hypothetical protein